MRKKIALFQRKPMDNNYSVEGAFKVIGEILMNDFNCVRNISRFESRGICRRIYNIIDAAFRQGDINHITGDVHFLSYLLRKKKTIITILDCVFMYNTYGIKRYLLKIFWYLIPEKKALVIVAISQSTKNEILKILKCDPSKIEVIPVCISPHFYKTSYIFNIKKPKILQVGTTKNKNLLRTIQALNGISCKLVIIGKISEYQYKFLIKNKIDYENLVNLTEQEMILQYIGCDLVTFTSTYEGFGMPILEANATGRPIITSNILSMPEVAGDAACLVNPYSVAEIRKGIISLISDHEYRTTLINNGFKNIKRFDPIVIAEMYSKLYHRLLSNTYSKV